MRGSADFTNTAMSVRANFYAQLVSGTHTHTHARQYNDARIQRLVACIAGGLTHFIHCAHACASSYEISCRRCDAP